jgi:RimJ/RimL family protein N-acetyltransferase
MITERLEIRDPTEAHRERFVELRTSEEFMVFSAGVETADQASARFDRMLEVAAQLPFARRPVFWRATGAMIGYAGVTHSRFEEAERLDFGWRLTSAYRGQGVGFEATSAVMDLAIRQWDADRWGPQVLAYIDPRNEPSQGLAAKLGFQLWKTAEVDGFVDQVWTRSMV